MPRLLSYPDIKWKADWIPKGNLIACDTETTGLNPYGTNKRDPDRIFIYQFANEHGKIGVVRNTPENKPMLKAFFENKKITKIFHNLQFDVKMIGFEGIEVRGKLHDTLIQSKLVDEYQPSHRLEDLAASWCGFKDLERKKLLRWFAENKIKASDRDYSKVPEKIMYPYAAVDAWNCMQLHYVFSTPMKNIKPRLYRKELACAVYIIKQENRGILTDQKYLREKATRLNKKCKSLSDKVRNSAGARLELSEKGQYSERDIGYALFMAGETCLAWSPNSKKPKFDKLTLPKYDVPFVKTILKYRKLENRKKVITNQILANLDTDGVIHTNFNLSRARTGRFSSSKPNLQNISRDGGVRDGFIARPGYTLFYLDYSQVEVRMFAHFAKDQEIIEGYCSDPKFDVHTIIAHSANLIKRYGKKKGRSKGKTLKFAMLYGAGVGEISNKLEVSELEARRIRDNYHANRPALKLFKAELQHELLNNGFIEDPFGRQYHVPLDMVYKAPNALIQGTCCNILKEAMLKCEIVLRGSQSYMIQNIHDELVFEIHNSEWDIVKTLKEAMEDFHQFAVPLVVDVEYGKIWGQKKKVKIEDLSH